MINYFVENIILPVSDLLFGYNLSNSLKSSRQISKMGEKQLRSLQIKKLNKILDHSIRTVPFYSRLKVPCGDDPQKMLSAFPVLTKNTLKGNEYDFLSKEYQVNKLIKMESSGSSGIKTTIYISRAEHSILRAILINWWEWTGFFLGKPILQTGMTPKRGLLKGAKDWITNTVYCDAFNLSEEMVLKKLSDISKYKNTHLGGYASSLFVFAEIAEKHQLNIRFDAVISWGDKMFDHYKKKIEKVFCTTVFENYACNEGIMIGQKVDLDYFYIYTPNVYLELLDSQDQPVPDGQIGRVVITKLDGFAMPLIRYDTGDLAINLPVSKYPTNRKFSFPLLERVVGRNTDIIKTLDGKSLIVHTFTGIFEFYNEIKQFRVVQRKPAEVEIEYIPSQSFDEKVLNKIELDLKKHTQSSIVITWKKVESIPATASGKPQLIKNYLIENSLADVSI